MVGIIFDSVLTLPLSSKVPDCLCELDIIIALPNEGHINWVWWLKWIICVFVGFWSLAWAKISFSGEVAKV